MTDYWMRHNTDLRDRINALLAKEGLRWQAEIGVRHLLTAITEDIGLDQVRLKVQHPLAQLKVAAHYGCHALRPGDVTQFDNPLAPTIFENIVAATGAEAVEWPLRLDCCGHPLWGKNDRISLALMQRKVADAGNAGAKLLVNACTYCQIQFDNVRRAHPDPRQTCNDLPAVLVSQLLGVAFGLPLAALGHNSRLAPGRLPASRLVDRAIKHRKCKDRLPFWPRARFMVCIPMQYPIPSMQKPHHGIDIVVSYNNDSGLNALRGGNPWRNISVHWI